MKKLLSILLAAFVLVSCGKKVEEINIGFIGPLTERAIDLGIGPAKALELAVKEYNESKDPTAPKINLFVEDDQWEKEKALPAYEKLRKEDNIQVLFISNTGGTIALQDKVLQDGVIMINQLNSDALLSGLNRNTFKIAKRTEDAHEVIGARITELGLKNVLIYHFPNDFMTRGAKSVESVLKDNGINYKTIEIIKGQTDFKNSLSAAKNDNVDGICFFGYRNFGFAMKQAKLERWELIASFLDLPLFSTLYFMTILKEPLLEQNALTSLKKMETTCSHTILLRNMKNYI